MLMKFNRSKMKGLRFVDKLLQIFFYTSKRVDPVIWPRVESVLVFDPTRIGDIVMLTPVLRIIRRNSPTAIVTLVCAPWGRTVLRNEGLVDHFVCFDGQQMLASPVSLVKNIWRLLSTLRLINRTPYDVALEPRGDLRYIFFLHFIRSTRKISYNYTGGESLLTDVVLPSREVVHLLEDKLFFLSSLGLKWEDEEAVPRLHLSSEDVDMNTQFLSDHDLLGTFLFGINPGASLAIKQWPYFAALLALLVDERKDAAFLVFEGPGEESLCEPVILMGQRLGARVVRVKADLAVFVRLVATCNHIVSNDSATAHLGAAFGVNVTVVSGPNAGKSILPIGVGVVRVAEVSLPCKPCHSDFCVVGGVGCLTNISPAKVLELIVRSGSTDVQ